jgi:hypothetical protein
MHAASGGNILDREKRACFAARPATVLLLCSIRGVPSSLLKPDGRHRRFVGAFLDRHP